MVVVAHARYRGRMRSVTRTGPSGETYVLPDREDGPRDVPVESLADARSLAGMGDPIEVEWTAIGKLMREAEAPLSEVASWPYRTKQKIVSELDLDVRGNASEETIDRELQEEIDQLVNRGEL